MERKKEKKGRKEGKKEIKGIRIKKKKKGSKIIIIWMLIVCVGHQKYLDK